MRNLRETLEEHEAGIYFGSVVLATLVSQVVPGTPELEVGINPAIALMLFVTVLQVPLSDPR